MKYAAEIAVVCGVWPLEFRAIPGGLQKQNRIPCISRCNPEDRVGAGDSVVMEVDLRVDGIITLSLYDEFFLIEFDMVKDGFMTPLHDSINWFLTGYKGEDSMRVMYISTQMCD